MSKLFVTVLGTGNYFDCLYYKDDKYKADEYVKTAFIQDALIKFLYKDKNLDFDMKVLLTDEAKKTNYEKLEKSLEKYNITPIPVNIPEGKNDKELEDIFDIVSTTIDESAQNLLEKHQDIIFKCYELNDILFKYNLNTKPTESFKINNIKELNKLWDILNNTIEIIESIKNNLQELLSSNKDLNLYLTNFIISNDSSNFLNILTSQKSTIDENQYKLLLELKELIFKYHELKSLLNKPGYDIQAEFDNIKKDNKNCKSKKNKKKTNKNPLKLFKDFNKIILNKIKDLLSLDVTVDITHSLRNIPIQIIVAMNYLTIFNDINLEGIYYGAFELGKTKINEDIFYESNNKISKLKNKKELALKIEDLKNQNNLDTMLANSILSELRQDNIDINIIKELENANCVDDLSENTKKTITADKTPYRDLTIKAAPICNLNTYYNLLKWTNAINSFIKCGNTNEIHQLSSSERSLAHQFNNKNSDNIETLDDIIKRLDNFTNCINTCRGMNGKNAKDELNSIKVAADNLYELLQQLDENISIKPLKKLFNLVSKKIEPFVGKNNLQIGLATVNWCIEYNLFQQGYTALEETIKTLLCEKLNLPDITEYENREDIVNTILTEAAIRLQSKDKDKDKDKVKGKDKDVNKNKDKINNPYNTKDFIEDCTNKLVYTKEFCSLSQTVKSFRNDINHFGFNKEGAKKHEAIKNNLNLHYSQLLKFIDGDFPWYSSENPLKTETPSEVASDSL